jgi:hypothetical protein
MLGSWTAHVLARTCQQVYGWDFDTVGLENLGTQAYSALDEGLPKAAVLQAHLGGHPFSGWAFEFDGKGSYSPWDSGPLVVISAVDSFTGRRTVAEWAAPRADLFIDTRAHGTVGVVLACPASPHSADAALERNPSLRHYLETLESDDSAPTPQCGAEGTAFVGMWVAQQVASTMVRFFKGLPVPYKVVRDVALDLGLVSEAEPMA